MMTGRSDISIAEKFLVKIADYCFSHTITGEYKKEMVYSCAFSESEVNNLCLTDLIGDRIFDYSSMFIHNTPEGDENNLEWTDKAETQAIHPNDFFEALESYGITPD
jgi:hypothetical protein